MDRQEPKLEEVVYLSPRVLRGFIRKFANPAESQPTESQKRLERLRISMMSKCLWLVQRS